MQGKTEQVTVNVLNGQVETFETQPVNIELESLNGSVSRKVTAYTANRVTGNMAIFDWNKCKKRWPYLREIDFPRSTKRQIVDVLIGLDCADLHCAIEEVRGKRHLGGPASAIQARIVVQHCRQTSRARTFLETSHL